jgi:hypothetical protein
MSKPCAERCRKDKAGFPDRFLACQGEKGRGFGKSVETFDQKVGLDQVLLRRG